jgi:hypothetical protein
MKPNLLITGLEQESPRPVCQGREARGVHSMPGIKHLFGEDCFHRSVQDGSDLDVVALRRGATIGFEFKHSDAPRITPSMSVAATDLGINRVYVVYSGPDTFALDQERRFVALAWRDLTRLQAGGFEG